MIGLMVLGALLIYGLILLSATAWMHRTVKKSGSSTTRSSLAAAFVALLILAPVFWDAIPTYIAFKYYSQKEAGLKVFKTLEQWKAENPGVAETFDPYEKRPRDKQKDWQHLASGWDRSYLNDRFAYDTITEPLFLSVKAWRYQLVDYGKEEVIASYVEVRSGNSAGIASGGDGWWKPWLIQGQSGISESAYQQWSKFREQAKNLGGK